jgi:hypothetical protein
VTREDEYTLSDLEVYLARELPEYERNTDAYRITHTVQVTSFGGSGTTALCAHLLAAGVDLQPGPGQWPFKHRRQPPRRDEVPEGFRVVYLLGDPRDAVLSIFRRKFQFGHYGALHGREPDPDVAARLETIEAFAAAGVDDFALLDHVDGWMHHPEGYPVLFVRYDRLRDAWEEMNVFVGLAPDHPYLPPRTRSSDRRVIPSPLKEQLDAMYGELARRIEALPPALLVAGEPGTAR